MVASERKIAAIDVHDFENRREQIKKELVDAAETMGFFTLVNQDYPSREFIEDMFSVSKKFFAQDDDEKSKVKFVREENTGWEKLAQVRPSTGTPDQKESLQLQYHRRRDNWPVHDPEFEAKSARFMEECQRLSMQVLSCLAEPLGFDRDFFDRAHRIAESDSQTTLRLLHYHDITGTKLPDTYWRAGAHTDFDTLTLLFQRSGEGGLEVCPGREAQSSFACGDEWTPVPARTGDIVINIGDMLMSWSDDRYKSNFHRVRAPTPDMNQGARYSIAFFNQANKSTVIQGPGKKYPALTGGEYILNAMHRNFESLKKMAAAKAEAAA